MPFHERVGNLHIHTTYSDGTARPAELVAIARGAGLDFIVLTDHNVYVPEHEGWHDGLLVLVGQEVHNPERPHANHCLVLNVGQDMVPHAADPQDLVSTVAAAGGIGIVAHPFEHAGPFSGEPEINWQDWSVTGFDALEIWNYMSEFKSYLRGLLRSLLFVFAPGLAISGPYDETLVKWDELLGERKVVAVGGTDAHATLYRLGPIARRIFAYEHLFRTVNLHLLVRDPWRGDLQNDAQLVYEAIGHGRSFIGYDLLAPTRGFRFTAVDRDTEYHPGDELQAHGRVCFRVQAPADAYLCLKLNGFCIAEAYGRRLEHLSDAPGVYRVEAHRTHCFKKRGWIYSNPIFIEPRPRSQDKLF